MTVANAAVEAGFSRLMKDTVARRVAGSPFSSQKECSAPAALPLPLVRRSLQLLGENAGLPRFMCMLTRMRRTQFNGIACLLSPPAARATPLG
jgi:hypothetical protein